MKRREIREIKVNFSNGHAIFDSEDHCWGVYVNNGTSVPLFIGVAATPIAAEMAVNEWQERHRHVIVSDTADTD